MVSCYPGPELLAVCDLLRVSYSADDIQAESITEGTLKQWNKQVGDHVQQDEEIATIETDKVSYSSCPF